MNIEAIAEQVSNEFQMAFDGVYLDFAKEVAERAVLAEREALEAEIEALADEWDDPAEAHGIRLALGKIKARSNAGAQATARGE